jgi:tetratricopeptide (TPR) repeat protein
MVVPSIFVAGSDIRSALHHQLLSVLRDEGADTWLYEWSSGEDPLSADVVQALYKRPVTLITVSDADIVPGAIPRILRSTKAIALFNPARLVLPLPVGLIDAERLTNLFPFAAPLVEQPTHSAADMINRALTFTALQPRRPDEVSSPESRLLIGQALISQQRFAEAVGWLLPLSSAPVPPRGAQSALAYCYARLEQWEACIETSKVAFEKRYERILSSYCLGLGLNGLGQYQAAIHAFRRALVTNTNISGAWVGLGIAWEHVGRFPEALHAFERGLAVAPDNAWAYEDPTSTAQAHQYTTSLRDRLKPND